MIKHIAQRESITRMNKVARIRKAEVKLYKPNEVKNVAISSAVIMGWASLFHEALFVVKDISSVEGVMMVPCLAFMYTGIFITGHDAMHGNITRNQIVNDAIGHVCMNLYAGFDFDEMRHKHMLHHLNTGITKEDPDFHKGNPAVYAWFISFMLEYFNAKQILKLILFVQVLKANGAPDENLYAYMALCGMLSSLQLFYFGTYIPHKPPGDNLDEVMNWEKSKSTTKTTRLESFLTCFHFDCHFEHHAIPQVPWFELWNVKEQLDE